MEHTFFFLSNVHFAYFIYLLIMFCVFLRFMSSAREYTSYMQKGVCFPYLLTYLLT